MAKIGIDIAYAASLLREGKLVGIPTDTVYGLAGNALNKKSVKEIFKVKKRPSNRPLLTQVDSVENLNYLIDSTPPAAKVLINKFWPGPLTLVMKAKGGLPAEITENGETIGIRIPNQTMSLYLLKEVSFPLAVTSANVHGKPGAISAVEVNQQIGDQIEYILDGGTSSIGVESTIVGFDMGDQPIILRLGAISKKEIEHTLRLSK